MSSLDERTTGTAEPAAPAGRRRTWVSYLAMVVVPVVVAFFLLRSSPDGGATATGHPGGAPDPVAKLLFALPVIFLACRLLSALARRLAQPTVIGEIFAGILLGPSFLGWVWPAAYHWIFPDYLASTINTFAQIGLVIFMFLVG